MTGKMAILTISPEVLRTLFQLPNGVVVESMEADFLYNGNMKLKISGAGWETPEGCCIIAAPAATITEQDGSRMIDWHLPEIEPAPIISAPSAETRPSAAIGWKFT